MAEEKNMTVATEEKTEAAAPKTESQYLLRARSMQRSTLPGWTS